MNNLIKIAKFGIYIAIPLFLNLKTDFLGEQIRSFIDWHYHQYISLSYYPFVMYSLLITSAIISLYKFNHERCMKLTYAYEILHSSLIDFALKILGSLSSTVIVATTLHRNELLIQASLLAAYTILLIIGPVWISKQILSFSDERESPILLPRGYKYAAYTFNGITIIASFIGLFMQVGQITI